MRIRLKSKTKEQFSRRFVDAIKVSEKHEITFLNVSASGAFSGSINGDSFTLVRTTGFFSTLPQRHFEGTLLYENEELIAEGRFCFSKTVYIVLATIGVCCFLFLVLSAVGALSFVEVIKAFLISAAVPTLFFGACLLTSRFFEKEAVHLLENL